MQDVNEFCRSKSDLRYCDAVPALGAAYSQAVTDYEITDFGVIHEISGGGPYRQSEHGRDIYGLGAWNFRLGAANAAIPKQLRRCAAQRGDESGAEEF